MKFLDNKTLDNQSDSLFQKQEPYPWLICRNVFTEDGLTELQKDMPSISLYTYEDGWEREGGQKPHVRYGLIYKNGLPIPKPWLDFIEELQGVDYRNFIKRMFGVDEFDLVFYWQLARAGSSVSPHCDSVKKIGSHIFYLNNPNDWETKWGGATLVLDDSLKYKANSSPDFGDLKVVASSEVANNSSFLFARTDHSWHGVKELRCPEDAYRKLFTVIVNKKPPSLLRRFLHSTKNIFNGDR